MHNVKDGIMFARSKGVLTTTDLLIMHEVANGAVSVAAVARGCGLEYDATRKAMDKLLGLDLVTVGYEVIKGNRSRTRKSNLTSDGWKIVELVFVR